MDTRTDNPQSQMEKAEGSREDVNLGQQPEPPESEPMERGAGQVSHPDKPIRPPDHDNAGGSISNRPLSEEERNQRDLPRRGQAKDEYESPFKV